MNKLPWFTHDHDAHQDLFIQEAMDKFGHFGYSSYFIILELLHNHGVGDTLKISASRLCQKLRSRRTQVRLYLDFCQTSGKVQFDWNGDEVRLQIKKFLERQAKTRFNHSSKIPQPFPNNPEEREEEREVHVQTNREAPKRASFVIPTVEEIKAYCLERKNQIDPQGFFDFYQSKGWMVGSNKMKDWKAAVRTWERKNGKNTSCRIVGSGAAVVPGKYDHIGR